MIVEEAVKCPYCEKPVTFKWDEGKGFVSEADNVLIADAVFHAKCFDKLLEENPP